MPLKLDYANERNDRMDNQLNAQQLRKLMETLRGGGRQYYQPGMSSEGDFNHMGNVNQLASGGLGGLATLLGFNNGLLSNTSQRSPINQGLADQARSQNQAIQPVIANLLNQEEGKADLLRAQTRKTNAEADSLRSSRPNDIFSYGDMERQKLREKLMFESQMKERAIAQRLKQQELARMAEETKGGELQRQIKGTILRDLLPSIRRMVGM